MKIILIDKNIKMCNAWKIYFKKENNVEIINSSLSKFDLRDIDCIVSPANSYGIMDGGYDEAIIREFGDELQNRVQEYIINNLNGEQVKGTAFIIDIPNTNKKLIHSPSMRVPSKVSDYEVIYSCMRQTLLVALANNVNTILIPAFGAGVGEVECHVVSLEMYKAFISVFKLHIGAHSWQDINELDDEFEAFTKLVNSIK